jgi:site-specific DNA-methyltransferase (cytosine-N4-specific)
MFSVKGETVLDPFLGSGTTVKIAILNERNSIGYELDSKILPTLSAKVEKAKIDKDAQVTIIKRP